MRKNILCGVICSLSLGSVALAQSSSATISSEAASSSAGAIAAPISVAAPAQAKKWSAMAYYGAYSDVSVVNRQDEVQENYQADAFVQVRRDIGNGQKLAFRVNAMRNQTDATKTDEWALFDPQFIYSFPVFASSLRLNLPVSEWSREVGRLELRYNGGNDLYKSGAFTLSSSVEGRAYSYYKEEDGQRSWRGRLGATAMYEVNSVFSPYVAAIHEWNKYYHGLGVNIEGTLRDRDEMVRIAYLDVGAEFNVIPKVLNINAYVEQARVGNISADKNLLAEDQSAYNIEFTLSM